MTIDRSVPPLHEIQVIDFTTGIAGPYCTKLFCDAGAEVVKIEPPGGDPLRRYAATVDVPLGEDGALFRYLNAGKKSLVGRTGDPSLSALIAGADLIVEDLATGAVDIDVLRNTHPHVVVVSITPFGRSGPMASRPATDFTLQAESGAIKFKGPRTRPPVQAGGRISEFLGGLFAAPGALAAVLSARETGIGEHIDVSLHDVMAVAGSNYSHVLYEFQRHPEIVGPMRYVDTPGIERASDGLVAFNTNAGHMLQLFLLLIERPDLVDDPSISSIASRIAMGPDWQKHIDAWTKSRTVDEILELASALRVPAAPVHDGATIVADKHLVEREVFVDEGEGLLRPRPPYLIDGHTIGAVAPAPALGAHDGEALVRPRAQKAGRTGDRRRELPLSGLKVIDLTSWWVGALASQTLAMLGADVIHVEGVAHPDGMRLTGSSFARTPDWWEWGHMFAAANSNKRGIAIDLTAPKGRAAFDSLVTWADVLIENFSPRVADSWGLTSDAVLALNPNIVYQRMPAYGLSGPWRDRPAFAQTIEPMSTMASITGFEDQLPLAKGGLADPVAGMHGAWSLLVALAERRHRKSGVFVEAVMIESALNVTAQTVLEHCAYGTTMTRQANRSPGVAPQGAYPSLGDDEWLAISVVDDVQWVALATLIGGPDLANEARYATFADRQRHHDELDAIVADWSSTRHAVEAAELLGSRGVPAARCWDPRVIHEHLQYRARHLFSLVDHPVVGPHLTPGLPYRFSNVDRWVRTPAPTFGQHNHEVLSSILGFDSSTIENLERQGVIAQRPRGLD
jgi:crotonobetainyl-CoA:carnitine CoA-transferase CaiB-like acyl-CoA transferase